MLLYYTYENYSHDDIIHYIYQNKLNLNNEKQLFANIFCE